MNETDEWLEPVAHYSGTLFSAFLTKVSRMFKYPDISTLRLSDHPLVDVVCSRYVPLLNFGIDALVCSEISPLL